MASKRTTRTRTPMVVACLTVVLLPIGCANLTDPSTEHIGARSASSAQQDAGGVREDSDRPKAQGGERSRGDQSGRDADPGDNDQAEQTDRGSDDDASTTLLASDHPSWDRAMANRMCFGNGVDRSSADAEKAEALMHGRLQLGSHDAATLASDPDWDENPVADTNWAATYHKLTWLDVLRREGIRTDDQQMLDRWKTLLADWVEDNPRGRSASDRAWREVPTAQRAVVLTCAFAELGDEPWLREAIEEHGDALTDPKLRVEIGNHAMLQNNGLLAVGCLVGNERWARMAYEANDTLLERAVDEQGVSDEGSIAYQNNNYRWWHKTADRLDACGLPPWTHLDRLERMPNLMAHATVPDGTYAMLGDTMLGDAGPVEGTVAEYAATGGKAGPRPEQRIRAFDRGYVFGRSGWGDDRPFDQESFFSLRFGMPRDEQVHAHRDHGSITFYSHGKRLLHDQGLFAFDGGEMRAYVRSAAGHNTVTVNGAEYDTEASAELVAQQETSTHALFTVRVTAEDSTTWWRTLFYSKRGRYLVVDDRVRLPQGGDGPDQRTAVQRFHLGSDRTVRRADDHVHTVGKGTDVGLFWLGNRPDLDVARGEQNPLQGWRSVAYRESEPAPVARATLNSPKPRFTTVVAPLPGEHGPDRAQVDNVRVRKGSLSATVRVGGHTEWFQIRPDGATVTPSSWLYAVTDDDEKPARRADRQ